MAQFPPLLEPFGEDPPSPARPEATTTAAPAPPVGHRGALWPPFAPERDHVDGPSWTGTTLLAFGAYATPSSRLLGEVLDAARPTVRVDWRHYPDETADPHARAFALAAEAAATRGKFWVLTREPLKLDHDDPEDLHTALVRAGLDPEWALEAMRAHTGAGHIDADVASAQASGVAFTPRQYVRVAALLGAAGSLPFSRSQESDADHIGLVYMARAGYDPRQAVEFWTRMRRAAKGKEPPEFVSDHPSDEHRIQRVEQWLPEAERAYTRAPAG